MTEWNSDFSVITIPNGVSVIKARVVDENEKFQKPNDGIIKYIKVTSGKEYGLTLDIKNKYGCYLQRLEAATDRADVANTWIDFYNDGIFKYGPVYYISYSASINEHTPDVEDLL